MRNVRRPPTASQQAYIPESFATQATIRRDYCGGTPAVETVDSEDADSGSGRSYTAMAAGSLLVGGVAYLVMPTMNSVFASISVNGESLATFDPLAIGLAVVIFTFLAQLAGASLSEWAFGGVRV